MKPPKSFLIDNTIEFNIQTPTVLDRKITLDRLAGGQWPAYKTWVVFPNDQYVLRESVLLQVIETVDTFTHIHPQEEVDTSVLVHMKLTSFTERSKTNYVHLMWKDRNNRSRLIKADKVSIGKPEIHKCYVFEEVTDYTGSRIIRFIYNTTDKIMMGKPSWV